MHTTSIIVPNRNRRIRRLMGAGVLALLTGAALTACASEGSAGDDEATTTTVSVPVDETTTTVAGGGASDDGGSTGGGTGGGDASGPTPTIDSFTTPEDIDCHNGSFQEFTASWSTTDAVEVTISIDGPGIYDTYPADGEASLPFNCSSAHTFLLTAVGEGGQTATRSVTLQPRNVQPDEEEADL